MGRKKRSNMLHELRDDPLHSTPSYGNASSNSLELDSDDILLAGRGALEAPKIQGTTIQPLVIGSSTEFMTTEQIEQVNGSQDSLSYLYGDDPFFRRIWNRTRAGIKGLFAGSSSKESDYMGASSARVNRRASDCSATSSIHPAANLYAIGEDGEYPMDDYSTNGVLADGYFYSSRKRLYNLRNRCPNAPWWAIGICVLGTIIMISAISAVAHRERHSSAGSASLPNSSSPTPIPVTFAPSVASSTSPSQSLHPSGGPEAWFNDPNGNIAFADSVGLGNSFSLSSNGETLALVAMGEGGLYARVLKRSRDIGRWEAMGEQIPTGDAAQIAELSADGLILVVGFRDADSTFLNRYEWYNNEWIAMGTSQILLDMAASTVFTTDSLLAKLSGDGSTLVFQHLEPGKDMRRISVYRWSSTTIDEDANNPNSRWIRLDEIVTGKEGQGLGDDPSFFPPRLALSYDGTVLAIAEPKLLPVREGAADQYNVASVYKYQESQGGYGQHGLAIKGSFGRVDFFGASVALSNSGNIVALGVPASDLMGQNSGTVVVYEFVANKWRQKGRMIHGGDELLFAGGSLALSLDGTHLAIGCPGPQSINPNRNQVQLHRWQDNEWRHMVTLRGLAGTSFGAEVGISHDGNVMAVGVPEFEGPTPDSGIIKLFENRNA